MIGIVLGWSVAGLAFLLVLVLFTPIHAVVHYQSGSAPILYLRWLFFRYNLSEEAWAKRRAKKKKGAPHRRKAKKAEKQATESDGGKTPTTFAEKLALGMRLLESAKEPTAVLLRKFRFYKIDLSVVVAGEDAAQTGIVYGQVSWLISAAYGIAKLYLCMATPHIEIRPDFLAEKGEVRFDVRGYLRPASAVQTGLRIAFSFLKRMSASGEKSVS